MSLWFSLSDYVHLEAPEYWKVGRCLCIFTVFQGWQFSFFFHPFKNSGNHMSWSLQFEYRIISYLLQTLRDDDDPSVTAISPHHNISSKLIAMNTGTDDLLFTSTTSWSWYFFRSLVFQQMRDETIWLYRYIDLKGFNEIGVGPCVDQPQKRALNIEFMIPMVSCFRLTWFLRHGHINCCVQGVEHDHDFARFLVCLKTNH